MAIDILSDRALQTMPEKTVGRVSHKQGQLAATASGEVSSSRTDAVELTAQAQTLARATAKAQADDGMDLDKINALRQALADGSYTINYDSVANHIIDAEDELSSIFA